MPGHRSLVLQVNPDGTMESSRQATNPCLRLSLSLSPERSSPTLRAPPRRPLFSSQAAISDPTQRDPQVQPNNQLEENLSHQYYLRILE